MAEDTTTKKVLIDIQLKSDQVKGEVVSLNTTLDTLLTKQFQLKAAGQQNTVQFVELASEIRLTKEAIKQANREIDNTSKALNAEGNSIKQNRALLSLLTADYIKLSQEEGKTAASTVALGKTIADLTDKLKKQEAEIKLTYRNVGNYADAFKQATNAVGNHIPILSQAQQTYQSFSQVITSVVQNFNVMGQQASAAEEGVASLTEGAAGAAEGVSGMSAAVGIAAGAFTAIAGAIAYAIYYLKQLDSVTDKAEQAWAGMQAGFTSFGRSVAKGEVGLVGMANNFRAAYVEAKILTENLQDLGDVESKQSVEAAKNESRISQLELLLRNRNNTAAQTKAYYDEIQQLSETNYQQQKQIADKRYRLAVDAALVNSELNKDEVARLRNEGVVAAVEFENSGKIHSGKVKAIADAQKMQTAAEQQNLLTQQRALNRYDALLDKQEAQAEKEIAILDKIAEAQRNSESERIGSLARTLAFEQSAFAKQLSQTQEHYRQLLFKQQDFIEKQKAIRDNANNSTKVRSAAGKAVSTGEGAIAAISKERTAETEQLLAEHNRNIANEVKRATLEVTSIRNAAIENDEKRAIAATKDQAAIQAQILIESEAKLQENIARLRNDIASGSFTGDSLSALKKDLAGQEDLLYLNAEKRIALANKTEEQINLIKKKAAEKSLQIQDQIAILNASGKKGFTGGADNPFNSELQAAKQKLLLDNYNAEVSQKGLTEEAKLLIEKEYQQKSKDLTAQNEQDKRDMIVNGFQQVASAGLSILSSAAKSDQQAKEAALNKEKARELSNKSLTSAQKLSIDNKYRALEGQAKVKAFRTEQKLAIVKAVIDTAAGVVKASPNPILMALAGVVGALQVGIIAAQKPPAFAQGGTFKSDGKGSILPGYSKKDNVNAQLRSGEAVIVSEAVRDPYARSILSGINQAFGGRSFGEINPGRGYAIGGIVTDGNNSNRYYAQPQQGTENLANTIAYSLINNFPPIITQVRDINTQQSILNKTTNRVDI